MEVLIDAMLGVACDRMNLALTFNDGVFAGRDGHARLLDPFARVGGLGRDRRHVALLLDGLGDVGDGLVVQAEKDREFFCHGPPQLTYLGTASRNNFFVSSTPARATS